MNNNMVDSVEGVRRPSSRCVCPYVRLSNPDAYQPPPVLLSPSGMLQGWLGQYLSHPHAGPCYVYYACALGCIKFGPSFSAGGTYPSAGSTCLLQPCFVPNSGTSGRPTSAIANLYSCGCWFGPCIGCCPT
jgi:hypothetical protein